MMNEQAVQIEHNKDEKFKAPWLFWIGFSVLFISFLGLLIGKVMNNQELVNISLFYGLIPSIVPLIISYVMNKMWRQ